MSGGAPASGNLGELRPLALGRAPRRRWLSAAAAMAVVALFAGVYLIQSHIEASFGEYRATEEILYVESGELLKKVTLGYENLAADLYWLRTVQYFGGKRLEVTTKNYDLLEPLLWITVELDPDFKIAYTYGATFLSEPFPMGAGMPMKGIELIDRGIEEHPDYWRFYLDKGFIYFWYLEDYEEAAAIFLEGSKIPGAPYWMVATAGRTLATGGDRATARHIWEYLYQSAETPQQRDNALTHMKQLDALDDVDRLREAIARYHEATARYPSSWSELVSAGYLSEIPRDPAGNPYLLGSGGRLGISPESALGNLPVR